MSKNLVISSWVDEIAKLSAKESVKLYLSMTKGKGTDITELLLTKFLQYYTKELIMQALTSVVDPKSTNKETYVKTRNHYQKMKSSIQAEMALAFEKAFKEYANVDVDYYCQINPIADPINKLEC